MASLKQIEANRRNALKSTGPRTPEGKARSRMNAIRHGFASASQTLALPQNLDGFEATQEFMNGVDLERVKILQQIEQMMQQPEFSGPAVEIHVRRLAALERYSASGFRQLKRQSPKIE